jgi:hypothetical protein
VYGVRCTVYGVQCTVYGVRCTVYTSTVVVVVVVAFAQHPTSTSRQGAVPDMMWVDGEHKKLGDVKTVGLCSTWYPQRRLRGARGQCVRERANAVHKTIVRQAKQLDEKYCGIASGAVGPVQRKLLSFGPVVGIVFGAFGEVSEGVRELVKLAARRAAEIHYTDMGAKTIKSAASALRTCFRRELAIANIRAHAHLKLRRLDAHVRNTHYGNNNNANSTSDRQHAARCAAYEASQGLHSRWSTTAYERRASS